MARPRRIRNPYPHRSSRRLRLSSAVLTCLLLAGLGPALTASTATALGLASAGVPPDGPPGNPDPPGNPNPPGPPNDPPPNDPPPNDPPPNDPPPNDPPPNDPPPNDPPPNDPPPNDPPPNDPPPRDPPPRDPPPEDDRPPCKPRCDDRPPCKPRCDDRPPCKPRCDERPPKHDSRRPFVVDESPRDGAFRVSTFTDVLVTFSESVRGVDRRSFRLFNARTGRSVFADVFRSGSSRRWVLVPDRRLSRGSRYVAVVKGGFSGIRDFAGNRLSTTTWTFRTGR